VFQVCRVGSGEHRGFQKDFKVISFISLICLYSQDDVSSITPLLVIVYLFCYAAFAVSEVRKEWKNLLFCVFFNGLSVKGRIDLNVFVQSMIQILLIVVFPVGSPWKA